MLTELSMRLRARSRPQACAARAQARLRALVLWAVMLALTLGASAGIAAVPDAVFESAGDDIQLNEILPREGVAGWFDVDLDGRPDPLWVSDQHIVAMTLTEGGEPQSHILQIPEVDGYLLKTPGGGGLIPIGVIDGDRDGVQELMIFAGKLFFFHTTAPFVLELLPGRTMDLPGFRPRDIAVGDINMDGWPDMVVSAMCFGTNASGQLSGTPDLVYMNLGGGFFEMTLLEPTRRSMTNGITLADLDNDGRLDVLESIDMSAVVGPYGHYAPGRLLWNRTPPGARTPVFEESGVDIDSGNSGMGIDMDDLDQDGNLDLYNTSVGLDELRMGRSDGTWVDETIERGILHEYGLGGQRMQWCPTFVDMNMDGRLDIFVREGGLGLDSQMNIASIANMEGMEGMEGMISSSAEDLVYVQEEDHRFRRSPVPVNLGKGGRQGAVGDLEGDGRPDVCLGGLPGDLGFFWNKTEVGADNHHFGVRFKTSVSAWPPTGARLEGTCGGATHTRYLAAGGKQGGQGTVAEFFAFPGCTETATVQVLWPSGVRSSHPVEPGVTEVTVEEPAWATQSDDGLGTVTMDPALVGAEKACVGVGESPSSCCEAADAPCELEVPPNTSKSAWMRLDDGPKTALLARVPFWTLTTDPAPPIPGQPVHLRLVHTGDPDDMPNKDVTLFVNGAPVSWEHAHAEGITPHYWATADTPSEGTQLEVALLNVNFPNDPWILDMNHVLDHRIWSVDHAIARHVTGGMTEVWNWMALVIGRRWMTYGQIIEHLHVVDDQGNDVAWTSTYEPKTMGRMQLIVSWDEIGESSSLLIHDGNPNTGIVLPVSPRLDLDQMVKAAVDIRGGVIRSRLSRNRDVSQVSVALLDADGNLLPPEEGTFTLEGVGGREVQVLDMSMGMGSMGVSMGYTGFVETDPDFEGDIGEVRVVMADGRVVGTMPFILRPKAEVMSQLGNSEATLTEGSAMMGGGSDEGTHEIAVSPRNHMQDLLGAEAEVTLEIEGGSLVSPMSNRMFGQQTGMIQAAPGATQIGVDVYIDGEFFEHLEAPVSNPIPLPEDPEDVLPDAPTDDVTGEQPTDPGPVDDDSGLTPSTPAPPADDGCGGAPRSAAPWWLLSALCLFMNRRRARI